MSRRPYLAVATLLCVTGTVAPSPRPAWAQECAVGQGPAGAAGTSALYGELANTVRAEPLSVDITARSIGGSCTWVYEVKVLTATGSVALLDFDLVNLGLRRVEGAANDPDIAKLYDRLKSGKESVASDGPAGTGPGDDANGSGSGSSGSGSGSGSDGGEGGEGGSGNDGGGSGSGGSGGSGSGSSGGGGSGGEGGSGSGGEGGHGGGGSGGGEGGSDD